MDGRQKGTWVEEGAASVFARLAPLVDLYAYRAYEALRDQDAVVRFPESVTLEGVFRDRNPLGLYSFAVWDRRAYPQFRLSRPSDPSFIAVVCRCEGRGVACNVAWAYSTCMLWLGGLARMECLREPLRASVPTFPD